MKVVLSVKAESRNGDRAVSSAVRVDLNGGNAYGQNPLIGLVNAAAALVKTTISEVSK